MSFLSKKSEVDPDASIKHSDSNLDNAQFNEISPIPSIVLQQENTSLISGNFAAVTNENSTSISQTSQISIETNRISQTQSIDHSSILYDTQDYASQVSQTEGNSQISYSFLDFTQEGSLDIQNTQAVATHSDENRSANRTFGPFENESSFRCDSASRFNAFNFQEEQNQMLNIQDNMIDDSDDKVDLTIFERHYLINIQIDDPNRLIEVDTDLKKNFVLKFQNVRTFACSIEPKHLTFLHQQPVNILKVNLYIEFSIRFEYDELKLFVSRLMYENNELFSRQESIMYWRKNEVKKVKKRKYVLENISKFDMKLYTNINEDFFGFDYRAFKWSERTDEFDHTDPFVTEHKQYFRFLKQYLRDSKKPKIALDKELRFAEVAYENWTMSVAIWYNNRLRNPRPRQLQLYLYGETRLGKSSYITKLIGKSNAHLIFYPDKGQFYMQNFNARIHRVILFEEFDIRDYPSNSLKRLLAGEKYAYSVKGKSSIEIKFLGPIIFVSNFFEIEDEALVQRLKVVRADRPFWLDRLCCLPKTENDMLSTEDQENIAIVDLLDSDEDCRS